MGISRGNLNLYTGGKKLSPNLEIFQAKMADFH
jgi:hypothetical protein